MDEVNIFHPNKGLLEAAAGLGYCIGPPIGGVLYAVSVLCAVSVHKHSERVHANFSFIV